MNNLRFAFRSLAKSPGFTFVAIVMLALGVGASTACFSFINAFFLRPPPFAEPASLVSVHMVDEKTPGLMAMSGPNFLDYQKQNTVFTDMAFSQPTGMRITLDGKGSNVYCHMISGSYFGLLGTTPAMGRLITPEDDRAEGAGAVIVLSHAFWQAKLGADPAVIGRVLTLNNAPFTVIGIAPEGFRGVNLFDNPDFWVPASMMRTVLNATGLDFFTSRRSVTLPVFARLKPGVTLAQAQEALRPLAADLAAAFPAENGGRSVRLVPLAQATLNPNTRTDIIRAGNLMMGLSALILLVACANLANLLLARAGVRQREIALRVALGASRRQVIGQLLRENFLLATAGGLLGILLAYWLRDLLWMLRPRNYPTSFEVPMDASVLAFALLATLLTGLLFGLAPAIAASRVNLVGVLKREPGGGAAPLLSFRHLLVAAQVALSVLALVIAGLFLRSLQQANAINLGWNERNLSLFSVNLAGNGYTPRRTIEYYQRALERLRSVPGVIDASVSSRPFLTGVNPQRTIRPQGSPDELARTRGQLMSYACVWPGYIKAMGIPFLAGRDIADQDTLAGGPGQLVVVVNETFAKRYWPGEDAVGKKVKLYNSEDLWEVIGVTRDIRDVEMRADPAPFAFFDVRQLYNPGNAFHVRTAGDPAAILPTLRKELQAIDPATEMFTISIQDLMKFAMWGPRTGATLMSVFGGIALLLTTLGIYAVMAHAVGQRTREIGIRLAIGAQARSVVALIIRRGIVVTGFGLFAGIATALALTRYVGSFLFEVSPTDPLTFAAIAVLLTAIALLACYLPARRATKVDPLIALRTD
jgi:macrolide transport system ATP-binding/permease protein